MKRIVSGTLLAACVAAAGCAGPQGVAPIPTESAAAPVKTAEPDAQVIARVNGEPITMRQLIVPLLKSRGLPLLLNLVQLDLARQDNLRDHIPVTAKDIQDEQNRTLTKMFKDADQREQDELVDAEQKKRTAEADRLRDQIHKDREELLAQYLNNQHYSRAEYDVVIEINANLRKAAEERLRGKITDAMIEREFRVEYGETAKVRMIQLANMHEVQIAQLRLKAGESFEQVARQMSRDPRTGPLGGEMPIFSLQSPGLPDEFKQLVFVTLQPGQVSDPLEYKNDFYLIKLERKFAPRAVKLQDVKESLRQSMYENLTESVMAQLRENLADQAINTLTVTDPLLSEQFEKLKADREGAIHGRQNLDREWKSERSAEESTTQPTSAPDRVNLPAPGNLPAPATMPAVGAPSATHP